MLWSCRWMWQRESDCDPRMFRRDGRSVAGVARAPGIGDGNDGGDPSNQTGERGKYSTPSDVSQPPPGSTWNRLKSPNVFIKEENSTNRRRPVRVNGGLSM